MVKSTTVFILIPKGKKHEKSILHSITDESHVEKAGSGLFPKIISGSFIKRINIANRIDASPVKKGYNNPIASNPQKAWMYVSHVT